MSPNGSWTHFVSSESSASKRPASDQFRQHAPDLERCRHIFLRQDTTRRAWSPLQRSLPGTVMERESTATPVASRPLTLSTDRDKPAYILNGTDSRKSTFKTGSSTTYHAATADHTNYALRSQHPFPRSPQHLNNHLHGCVKWKPPTLKKVLPNPRSPRQLQRPLVRASHSDKCMKMRTSDTLASGTERILIFEFDWLDLFVSWLWMCEISDIVEYRCYKRATSLTAKH
jgi:hypothetical protein